MAKTSKMRKMLNVGNGRVSPCSLSCSSKVLKDAHRKKYLKSKEKKEWKAATCSVCMEHPHNAVLLLCSSYDRGCRPYMCATGTRYSNCLEQYKKAYTKLTSTRNTDPLDGSTNDSYSSLGLRHSNGKTETSELLCPLCRGQVKGWTVVEPARKYLNRKRRSCTRDNCSFVGTYKELKRHVKAEHPWARPREVDPCHVEKWKRLEHEREQEDVISTITSSMPGAIVIGDYVIERPLLRFSNYREDSAGGDAFSWWEDEDSAIGRRGAVSASGASNLDNTFFSRLSNYYSRVLSRRRRRPHRTSN